MAVEKSRRSRKAFSLEPSERAPRSERGASRAAKARGRMPLGGGRGGGAGAAARTGWGESGRRRRGGAAAAEQNCCVPGIPRVPPVCVTPARVVRLGHCASWVRCGGRPPCRRPRISRARGGLAQSPPPRAAGAAGALGAAGGAARARPRTQERAAVRA
ncbi:MAG: hypothetical protein J3K34DRAFT_241378 [Monoraphidium minutum]|nr:MAG: hypothetical protein J3K34DRAFT_241378 [Monoraphidium minutum]